MILPTKELYTRFLKGHEGKLHFAAHSHHFWPDVSREAHLAYWDDCAKASDEKWNKIFGEVIPNAQKNISDILNLKHPEQIVFAPNTHELTSRLLSLFLGCPKLNILTTSSEFHSWKRQISRLTELPLVTVKTVSTQTLLNSRKDFLHELKEELNKGPDLFFISQVFFDSGIALTDQELLELKKAASPQTIMVVDGYHGFGALPCNLSELEGQIFYLAGGYKYAQAGEGVGFMVVPKGEWRPAYTGWFAEYEDLSKKGENKVGYAKDAMAFMGATQDPSGLYRFNGVWSLFKEKEITTQKIHQHVRSLQLLFLEKLPPGFTESWSLKKLFSSDLLWHGHFLTFEAKDPATAERCQEALKKAHFLIDRRSSRLRFGFGLYHNAQDVEYLTNMLKKLAP